MKKEMSSVDPKIKREAIKIRKKIKKPALILFSLLFIAPYVLLRLTGDYWVVRLISVFLFWTCLPGLMIFLAFAPIEYWLSPRNAWQIPSLMSTSRVLFFALGFASLIGFTTPCIRGIWRLTQNDKLEKVIGVINREDAPFPTSIVYANFTIEGRKKEIFLYYYKFRIFKWFPVGTKAEFYLLPGTDYAMDVRPASADNAIGDLPATN
jgi:hypothetical protein